MLMLGPAKDMHLAKCQLHIRAKQTDSSGLCLAHLSPRRDGLIHNINIKPFALTCFFFYEYLLRGLQAHD